MRRLDLAYLIALGVLLAAGGWSLWQAHRPLTAASAPSEASTYRCEIRGDVARTRRFEMARWQVWLRAANGAMWMAFVSERLLPGDRVIARGVCAPAPGYFTPGSASPTRRRAAGGYDGVLRRAEVIAAVAGARADWRRVAALGADAAYDTLARHVSDHHARALLVGMVLGTSAELSPEDLAIWRDLGLIHALSVSGLHLAVVALYMSVVVNRLALLLFTSPRRALLVAQVSTATACLAYAAVTGMQVATVRALVMTLLALWAMASYRGIDAWRLLIISLAAMVAWEPGWLADPSFQLSATATAALISAAPWFMRGDLTDAVAPRRRWRRMITWLGKTWAVSAWVTVVTAPIVVVHFHQLAVAAPLVNAPVTAPCELTALPLALLGVCLAPLWDGGSGVLLWTAQQCAAASLALARLLARGLPALELSPPDAWSMVGYAVALVGVWWWVAKGRWGWGVLGALTAGLAVAAPRCMWPRALAHGAADEAAALVVTFLDIGQGDAALVEFPGGARWLIDAGGDASALGDDAAYDPVLRYLRTRRIRALDRVVITHAHRDHVAALCHLAGRIEVRAVWLAKRELRDVLDLRVALPCVAALAHHGAAISAPTLGDHDHMTGGGVGVEVIGPRWHLAAGAGGAAAVASASASPIIASGTVDENDNSLVLVLRYGGRSVAFMGDAEALEEATLVPYLAHVDAVKVGHHGSKTSSSPALVHVLAPTVAVVSVGRGNRFGLPDAEALVRWAHRGARVLRTDLHGTIQVRIAPNGVWQWFTYLGGVVGLQ